MGQAFVSHLVWLKDHSKTMPYIGLFIRAELDGVDAITFPPDFVWTLDVKNPREEEDVRSRVTIDPRDQLDVPGGKGTANFLVKWQSKATGQMSIIEPTRSKEIKDLKAKPLGTYTRDDSGRATCVAVFECRGVEPQVWHAPNSVRVKLSGGCEMSADLTEDWYEYDENTEAPVEITNLVSEFRLVK